MCGFAGYVDFRGAAEPGPPPRVFAERLVHRGPDEEGTWTGGACVLAHRRLSVIDPSSSRQPMVSGEGDCALVTNAEIYNYRALRDAGGAGPWTTDGDTEVILRRLRADGADALGTLDGMFAVAFWDGRRNELLLARDPFGIKPLYVARPRPDLLVFGSHVPALLAHPEVDGSLDEDERALLQKAIDMWNGKRP